MARITVTQLKHACLDSSWLDRWLRDPDVALPAPREWSKETGVPARKFHELAQKFADWLCDPATSRNAIRLDSYEKLWGALWQELAQKEVLAILRKKGPEAANRLS
jgi:hypothetical protein